MTIRLPSQVIYASQVQKEQYWLPIIAPHLPLAIPQPIAMGLPTEEYPCHWSIYKWLEGDTATYECITDLNKFAEMLAKFLRALQHCNTENAPPAGPDNFYRGGELLNYDKDTRKAINNIKDSKLANALTEIWGKALSSAWQSTPVWVHGDIAIGNLLVSNGELSAVIDFGQLAVGDPACDLAIYWTFLENHSRKIFSETINLDDDTWDRAKGWVLWKTLCAPIKGTDCDKIIKQIILVK